MVRQRRSIRLKNYDYSSWGMYFVTICVQNRICLFGNIDNDAMQLNAVGKMVCTVWQELEKYYMNIKLDSYVIMPNHLHGIIYLTNVGATPCGCPLKDNLEPNNGQARGPAPTLPDIVHRYKSLTTAKYRKYVHTKNWKPFDKRLWQRNYYERIIRNEKELYSIRNYIFHNPMQWESDQENPKNQNKV